MNSVKVLIIMQSLKKLISAFLIKGTTHAGPALAYHEVLNGSYQVSNTEITKRIKINGEAVLGSGTVAKDLLLVNGSLKADGVIFEKGLTANGTSTVSNTVFNDWAEFNGALSVTNSSAYNVITILNQTSNFKNCQLKTIYVKKNPYIRSEQSIRLSNTIISRDVTFESGTGIVYLDSSSEINGTVIGGSKAKI